MATQRQYEAATVFTARIVDMRHLWTPSTEFRGQQTQKPNYFATCIVPKTQAHWSQEPAFAGVMGAFGKLLAGSLQWAANNVNAVTWPIADGDMPSPDGKTSEFAKGHWLFSASSGNPPNVELAQAGGALVKLPGRAGVKPGDHVMVGITAAVKQNDPRGVKFYLNAVVFTAPGEEIVFANSVSGAELMRLAQAQGLQVQGFASAPGPAGFAPQGGFPGVPGGFTPPPGPGGYAPGVGFGSPATQGAPGQFVPPAGGFGAPGQAPGGFAAPAAPAPGHAPSQYPQAPAPNGNATFPSNQQQFPGAPPAPGSWPQR